MEILSLLISLACAFYGLTSVILPFTASTHISPKLPEDVIEMVQISQPQVLILPAGLAVEDLEQIKSLKSFVVVDNTTAPHMDWREEGGDIPVHTWPELLGTKAHHEPCEPALVAIESFVNEGGKLKSIQFSHHVNFPSRTL